MTATSTPGGSTETNDLQPAKAILRLVDAADRPDLNQRTHAAANRFADQTCTVDGKRDSQVLDADVMNKLVVGTLQEG